MSSKPIIAHAIGCPAGIAPELSARMLADPEIAALATIVVVGDRRVLERGAERAAVRLDVATVQKADDAKVLASPVVLDLENADPHLIEVGQISEYAGQSALANFRTALDLARDGIVDAVTFSPFNKAAMRCADPGYVDEIEFVKHHLRTDDSGSEYNILPGLWNARVTSHIPLAAVASSITRERVVAKIMETDCAMRSAGFALPRIAVAGLNPHAGDNGNFGREEIDQIAPAIAMAREQGVDCAGPLSPDTIFLAARSGRFDAVLTMYHDQGQIAMKLMGFDSGVTLLGGFSFPVLTASHGSAYDIAGQGIANPSAMRHAMLLAGRMCAPARD